MRKLLLIVVVAACAKSSAPREGSKQSAEATGGAPAETLQQAPQQAPPPPPVAAPTPTTAAEPDMQPKGGGPGTVGAATADRAKAKEVARQEGVLGPTDQDLFTPIEPGIAKILKGPIAPTAKDIQACYDRVRAKDTTVVGELSLKFKYNADGTTADVVIDKSTVKSTELETCVIDVLKAAKLTPAKATVKATARISFKKA